MSVVQEILQMEMQLISLLTEHCERLQILEKDKQDELIDYYSQESIDNRAARQDWLDAIPKKSREDEEAKTIHCLDGVTRTAKEYEEWAEGQEGEYPDLDLEAAKEARGHRD